MFLSKKWALARRNMPGGRVFNFFFALEVGNSPIKKLPEGGMVTLGID